MITNLKRSATAVWTGTGLEGKGVLSTRSSAIKDLPYSYKTRFQNEDGLSGTNPEELLAAAHAGCFNMALSFQLNSAGYTATKLETEADVQMAQKGFDYSIARINLSLKAVVTGIEIDEFKRLAEAAKKTCPISMALAPVEVNLNVELN